MAEFAGALSERVRFERRREGQGAAGEPLDIWQLVCERWASVELLGRASQSALLADTRHSARRWRFALRQGPAVSIDMRVVWRGLVLRITGIEDDPAFPGQMVVIADDPGA